LSHYSVIIVYIQTMKGYEMILSNKELDKKAKRLNLFSNPKNVYEIKGLDKAGYYEEYFGK